MDENKRAECLFREFEMYEPTASKNVKEYYLNDYYELVLVLDDGEKILYDSVNHMSRRIHRLEDEMTEIQFRREFAMRLARRMMRDGVSQRELSVRTGLSIVSISHYINGNRTPSFYNVRKIARALGCSADELLRFPE